LAAGSQELAAGDMGAGVGRAGPQELAAADIRFGEFDVCPRQLLGGSLSSAR